MQGETVRESGKYRLSFNSKDGFRVTDKEGKPAEVSEATKQKYFIEAVNAGDFDNLPKTFDPENPASHDITSHEQANEVLAKESQNPAELAQALADTPKYEDAADYKTQAIAEYMNHKKVNRESFNRFGDKNKTTRSLSLTWFAKKANAKNSQNLDVMAQEVSHTYYGDDMSITPQDLADFIIDNPKGWKKKINPQYEALQNRFAQITGVNPTPKVLKAFTEKAKQAESPQSFPTSENIKSDNPIPESPTPDNYEPVFSGDVDEEDSHLPFQKSQKSQPSKNPDNQGQNQGNQSNRLIRTARRAFIKIVKRLNEFGLAKSFIVGQQPMAKVLKENGYDAVHFQQIAELSRVNNQFNKELDAFKAKKLGQNGLLHLGKPLEILKAAGIKEGEMTITQKTLKDHMDLHGLTTEDLHGLAEAIQRPILVYNWGKNHPSTLIVTEMTLSDGRKIAVGIRLENKGNDLTVNEIATIHGKTNGRLIEDFLKTTPEELQNEKLKWVEKEKVLNWLGIETPKVSTQTDSKLNSLANIIQNFQNPKIDEGFLRMQAVASDTPAQVNEYNLAGKYDTKLTTEQEPLYQKWRSQLPDSLQNERDYDLRGLWKENPKAKPDERLHLISRFKKPNHMTFSDESIYSRGSTEGGKWIKKHGKWTFYPSYFNLTMHSREEMQAYFNEYEEDSNLVFPPDLRFLRTANGGEIYGFSDLSSGKIYIDPDLINANTPIHELGHLWNKLIRDNHPRLWAKMVEIAKKSERWNEVKNDPAYANLKTDDDIADEVLSTAYGDNGEKMYHTGKIEGLNQAKGVFNQVWDWLRGVFGLPKNYDIQNSPLENIAQEAVKLMTSGQSLNTDQSSQAFNFSPHQEGSEEISKEDAERVSNFIKNLNNITPQRRANAIRDWNSYKKTGKIPEGSTLAKLLGKETVAELTSGENLRFQAQKRQADNVSDFIKNVLDGEIKNGKQFIDIPEQANRLAEKALGHKINSHRIKAEEVRHIWNKHGLNGTENTANSIPLHKEDIALMPYIMAAPDRIEKGTPKTSGVKSIKYIKTLSNGYAVVVEREGRFNVGEMEHITMWAEKQKSLSPNDVYAPNTRASHATSETLVISPKDIAKIRQDFNTAMEKMQNSSNLRLQAVYNKIDQAIEGQNLRQQKSATSQSSPESDNLSISDETDKTGNKFYQNNKGSINLWNIPQSVFGKIKRQIAPIRLTDFNVQHIIDRHGKEIGTTEKDVTDFVNYVFSNFTNIRKNGNSLFVTVENSNKTGKAAILKLSSSTNGDYYNVETAGYYRNKFLQEKALLWKRSEPINEAAETSDTLTDNSSKSAGNIINTVSQSKTSDNKDTNNSPTNQNLRLQASKTAYNFDTEGITPENAQEMQRIKDQAQANGSFMKAPNGKPTRLNERQWLQVRTDKFKKWFGDWEKVHKLQQIKDLEAIGINPHNLTDEQLRQEYEKIGEAQNKNDNKKVRFVNSTYGKITRHKGVGTKRIIPQLKTIFENSIPIYSEMETEKEGHKPHPNFAGYHNYLGKIVIDNKDYYVRFTVQEQKTRSKTYNPNELHSTFISDIDIYRENSDGSFPRLLTRASSNGISDTKLQKFFQFAKLAQENSSKVVDENGEPLEVAHSTDKKFTAFKNKQEKAMDLDLLKSPSIILK